MPRQQLARRRPARDESEGRPSRRSRGTAPADESPEEEYEDNAQPRSSRRSRSSRSEEPASTPRSARRSRGSASEGRAGRDDDYDDAVGSGRAAYKKAVAEHSSFSSKDKLVVKDEPVIIHFLDDEPFAFYYQHWVKREGQKSFTHFRRDCPLCDVGEENLRLIVLYNVVDMETGDQKFWECGPAAGGAIDDEAESKYNSPINRDDLYFEVKRKKTTQGPFAFSLTALNSDQIEDEGLEPLGPDEIEIMEANLFDKSVIELTSRRKLQEIANELED